MTEHEFKTKILNNSMVYGTLVTSVSPGFFKAALNVGYDFVFLDMEHITYDDNNLSWMCHAFKAAGVVPIVRILAPDPFLASKAIDLGASGIIAPYVETVEEVEKLVGAVKYKPLKGKKLASIMEGREPISDKVKSKLEADNSDRILLLNIESPEGVANMDSFLTYKGVDGIIIGPHDLSYSYDMPDDFNNNQYLNLLKKIIQRTRAAGRSAGCHTGFANSVGIQKQCINYGANIVLHGADVIFFVEKASSDLTELKKQANDLST